MKALWLARQAIIVVLVFAGLSVLAQWSVWATVFVGLFLLFSMAGIPRT